jgi:hypothetical protein
VQDFTPFFFIVRGTRTACGKGASAVTLVIVVGDPQCNVSRDR